MGGQTNALFFQIIGDKVRREERKNEEKRVTCTGSRKNIERGQS